MKMTPRSLSPMVKRKNKSGYNNNFIENNAASGMEEMNDDNKIDMYNNDNGDKADKDNPVTDMGLDKLDV